MEGAHQVIFNRRGCTLRIGLRPTKYPTSIIQCVTQLLFEQCTSQQFNIKRDLLALLHINPYLPSKCLQRYFSVSTYQHSTNHINVNISLVLVHIDIINRIHFLCNAILCKATWRNCSYFSILLIIVLIFLYDQGKQSQSGENFLEIFCT